MKVIICGAGQVGYGIAERLSQEGNDVSVIDTSASLVSHITETLDVSGYVGHGAHPDVLARAGADQAEMLIAVTLYDEINMTACQVAHSLFNVPTKIARIRSQNYLLPEYSDLFSRDNLPIDVAISPEIEVGKMVLRRISFPGATDIVRFADDHIAMLAIECMEDCPVVDTPLNQLSELFPDLMATVCAIWRNGRLNVARSQDHLLVGDLAYVICQRDHARRTLGLFGHEEQEAGRIVIAGGGNIGYYVAAAISRVLQHVRKGRIRAVYAVQKGKAEVIEAEALETSPLVGKPFRELDLPPGLRIGAILRDKTVIRPDGETRIKAKDRVVIFAMASAVRQVEQMFRVSLEFF